MAPMRAGGTRGRRPGPGVPILLALAASGHLGYPLWLLLPRRHAGAPPGPPADPPGLTIVIPAYRERNVIAAKLADVVRNGYPGRLQVVVVADDEETARAAAQAHVEVVSPGERLGKAEAINRGFAAAREPIVVLTDANTWLRPGALETLVRWFEDPEVGAVAGEKRVDSAAQDLYWRFESWLKHREARAGTTIGLVGELAAVRRSVFLPLPRDLAVDDMWLALDVIEQGKRVAYEPAATAYENASATWAEEWERRTRVGAGVIDNAWRRRALLVPGSGIAAQLWGHRVVRYTVSPLAHLALLLRATRSAPRSAVATAFLLVHAGAIVTAIRQSRGAKLNRLERLTSQVAMLQLVGLGGLARYLRGSRPALWPKPDRDAEGFAASPPAQPTV